MHTNTKKNKKKTKVNVPQTSATEKSKPARVKNTPKTGFKPKIFSKERSKTEALF